jgi:hypothetical protein
MVIGGSRFIMKIKLPVSDAKKKFRVKVLTLYFQGTGSVPNTHSFYADPDRI